MVSPLMSAPRRGENRRNLNSNAKYTPVGMTVVSPMSPIDTRMTPIRKSLFQRRRLTSGKRRKDTFTPFVEDDSRDDSKEIASLKSANKKKDGHLKVLQERFTHIQKGLGSIDEERNQLVEKAKRLDKEKKLIQKQLELREREILTLIKRCASQEEKMRESSKLRATNRDLNKQLDLMASKVRVIEEQTEDRENIRKMLQDSELEREQLKDRLARVQREHDAIADTLQECLGNIRRLTEEKNAIEEERRRERKRAEAELEKQQLDHVNASNVLKQNILEHQSRIQQMENILQDKIKSNTDLRREKAVISQVKHEEIKEVVEKYERQLQELRLEIEETVDSGNHYKTKNLEEVSLMKEKLKSKDDQIQELEKDFSDQMVMLMSKQSSLDESEEERKDLELKVESAKQLEIKHAALLDFVEILDSNLAELTTANAHLELEKDELREETEQLRKKSDMLQRRCSSLQNNQKAKESDFRELLSAENDEKRKDLEESLRKSHYEIASLQAELKSGNQKIMELENDLNKARKLIADKENEIFNITNQMEHLRSSLGADLRRARLQAAQFEAEVFAKNQTLASLEGRLEGAKAVREENESTEVEGRMNTQNQHTEGSPLKNVIQSLRDRLQSTETDSQHIRTELERTVQQVRNEAMFLQQKIATLSEEKAMVENEVETARSLINDRDEQIVQVQHMVLKHKKRALELERKLQDTTKELEDHREKIREFENEKKNLDEETVHKTSDGHRELEERILVLEKELSEAKISRAESMTNLDEAHKRIQQLQQQLNGEDAFSKSLQTQLQRAKNDLLESKSEARKLESEHHSTTKLQTERDTYSEEAKSRVTTLERKIDEMKKASNDLGVKMNQYRKENTDKDKIISSLKDNVTKGREETQKLRSELQIKRKEMEKLEIIVCEEKKNFDMQIEATNASLKVKEQKILDLEKIFLINDDNVKSLQDALSKAKAEIARLEDQISCEQQARTILEEKFRESNSNKTIAETPDDEFLPSSDTSDLKQKIHGLLTRQADLTAELDRTKANMELERQSWITAEQNYYKELSICKAKLLVLQNVLIERERVISSMQKDENGTSTTEKRILEQENVIDDLQKEILSKDKKIEDLERQFTSQKRDGIQYAFVESDKRRLEVEGELASAHKNIQELTVNVNACEERINADEEALTEKNNTISQSERRCRVLEEKVRSLDEECRWGNKNFLKLKKELRSMKTAAKEKEQTINDLNASILSLKEAAEKAAHELNEKNATVSGLTESMENLKMDLEKAMSDSASKDEKIKLLENSFKAEKESRLKLEGEIVKARECANESQQMTEALENKLEGENQGDSKLEDDLAAARQELEALACSSSEQISSLEKQISQLSGDLTRKDIEIRDLRFAGLASKKNDYESKHEQLTNEISQRDATIEELKAALLEKELGEAESHKQGLQKAESEARDQIEEMRVEYEEAVVREKELMKTKLRNKDALHKEELDNAQSELESTLTKLLDSERLLAERSCRLSEMVDHNRDMELQLEKEQTKLRIVEDKFFKEQSSLQTTAKDLRKVESELRRKESVLESKLKEERDQKEYAEESLKIVNKKYKDAMKTRRNVIELERENGELKDKIRRQEAYLQRKLEKEKMDRARLTPGKSSASPSARGLRTPNRRTPVHKTTNSPRRDLSQSSKFSRSRLQAPSTIGRGIAAGKPSIPRSRPKVSPTAASYRSARTTRSIFSGSTQLVQSPSKGSTLSAQDILQSELADDRSASSELSSLLGSPSTSPLKKLADLDFEPRE